MSQEIQTKVKEFLGANKVSTVCFINAEGKPYCINCFYVFDEGTTTLVFKSSYGTSHDALVKAGADVAGTIVPDEINVMSLKGIQFTGILLDKKEIDECKLGTQYIKSFPMSLAMPGYVWAVKLKHLKYTDNTLGFGNKTLWNA